MNQIAKTEKKASPAKQFRLLSTNIATDLLTSWVGDSRASEASGRIASALSASAASARDPSDFYACTPQSVGSVIAISALTGIMPSVGANALAYVIPRRSRKDEAPQLRYQLSHRGLNALARRCGQTMIPIPIGHDDEIEMDDSGEIVIVSRDIDNPPDTWDELRGIVVLVKQLGSNVVTFRGWVPKKVIESRRSSSDSYQFALKQEWAKNSDPWHTRPVEMSMKTAMHYTVARGWCVIDDSEAVHAMRADVDGDLNTVDAKAVAQRPVDNTDDFRRLMSQGAEVPPEDMIEAETEVNEPVVDDSPDTEIDESEAIYQTIMERLEGCETRAKCSRLLAAVKKDEGIEPELKGELLNKIQAKWEEIGN